MLCLPTFSAPIPANGPIRGYTGDMIVPPGDSHLRSTHAHRAKDSRL